MTRDLEKLAMTAADHSHRLNMPPACAYEVRAEFDHFVIRDDFVADLAGNSGHRFLEFQPQVATNTNGQLELHLTIPGPDVWTSLLTAMTVIRQSGYAPIAVHVRDNSNSTTTTHVTADSRPIKKSLIAFILAFRKKSRPAR
jgi:hypothetical protein